MVNEHLYKCGNRLIFAGVVQNTGFWAYMFVILYFIPMILLVFCYARIGRTLTASVAKQRAMQEGSQK